MKIEIILMYILNMYLVLWIVIAKALLKYKASRPAERAGSNPGKITLTENFLYLCVRLCAASEKCEKNLSKKLTL